MHQVVTIAVFFSVMAVWLLKYKYGWIMGALCIGICLGEYQSYIGLTMGICILSLIIKLFDYNANKWVKHVLRMFLMGGLGVIFYKIALEVSLKIYQTSLLSYKGIDTAGYVPIGKIPYLLLRTYKNIGLYILGRRFFEHDKVVTLFMFACILLTIVFLFMLIGKKIKKYLVVLPLLFMLPICINIVDFIAVESEAYSMNTFVFVLLFIFPLALYDKLDTEKFIKQKSILCILGCVLLVSNLGISWYQFIDCNKQYMRMSEYYDYTEGLLNRLLMRGEMVEGYFDNMPIAVICNNTSPINQIGNKALDSIPNSGLRRQYIGLWEFGGNEYIASQKMARLMNNMLGSPFVPADKEQIQEVMQTEEYLNMSIWPAANSVQIINGILVYNFCHPIFADVYAKDGNVIFDCKGERGDYTYAWYVYKDGEHIGTRWYLGDSQYIIENAEPGEYSGLCFVNFGGNVTSQYQSPQINVE